MTRFTRRSSAEEQMDGDVPPETFAAVLADLARVNTLTRARPPTLCFVERALRDVPVDTALTIIDVGFGDGDMLRALDHRLAKRPNCRLIGYDINPRSAPAARARTNPGSRIDYRTGDARAHEGAINLIVSSLVTHHMRDADIVGFLRWMESRATHGWFVNDLHRHALAYYGFRVLGALFRWHPMVRRDGALSVLRAFQAGDWEMLIDRASLDRDAVALRWHLPFRWCLGRLA